MYSSKGNEFESQKQIQRGSIESLHNGIDPTANSSIVQAD